jgi:hypothetical protein
MESKMWMKATISNHEYELLKDLMTLACHVLTKAPDGYEVIVEKKVHSSSLSHSPSALTSTRQWQVFSCPARAALKLNFVMDYTSILQ